MQKADTIHRLIAKTIDFLILGILSRLFVPFGIFAGAVYILIADGFFEGQSLGKKLVGVRVIHYLPSDKEGMHLSSCNFRSSMVRNLPYGLMIVLSSIPILGYIFLLLGLLFTLAETYFIYSDDKGIRIGDMYADTQVVDVGASET